MLDIEGIEARAKAATPGPWFVGTSCSWRRILREGDDAGVIVPTIARDGHPDLSANMADLEFAAHARTDIHALVAEVRKLRAALQSIIDAAETVAETWANTDGAELGAVIDELDAAADRALVVLNPEET